MSTPDATPTGTSSGTSPRDGRFVWHELLSTDPDAAQAFYAALFGWNYDPVPMPSGAYPMIRMGEATIGGVLPTPGEGVPSHWLGYLSVADVDDAVREATEAGGSVRVPPTDMPEMGRYAMVADPSGALISFWKGAHEEEPQTAANADDQIQTGTFVWNELLTTDPGSCGPFYTRIMPWQQESMTMPGPEGEMTYHLFKRSDQKDGCGMMEMPPGSEAPSHWLPYVAVEDVDAAVERGQGLGAAVHCPPTDIPNVGRFAVLADPQGACFAVYRQAENSSDC